MQILSSKAIAGHDHRKPGFGFTCSDCGLDKPLGGEGVGTGYARDKEHRLVCYECCGKRDLEEALQTGRATLYLTRDTEATRTGHGLEEARQWYVTNWPGTLKAKAHVRRGYHNMARYRYDAWFSLPGDGFLWHGVTYGDNTQICHCKRTKTKA